MFCLAQVSFVHGMFWLAAHRLEPARVEQLPSVVRPLALQLRQMKMFKVARLVRASAH